MSDEREKQIFAQNLKAYMKKNGKTQADLIAELNINKSTISTWCNGTKMPRMGTLQLLADYFGIKKSDLLEDAPALPADAIPYIPRPTAPIPIVGTVNCGVPLFAEDNIEGYIETPIEDMNTGETYFWLHAKGDSMINEGIREGDLLLIRQQNDVDSGSIAVVTIDDNEATLKRVIKKENALILQPANPAYETKIFVGAEMESIKIRGKLMKLEKRFY